MKEYAVSILSGKIHDLSVIEWDKIPEPKKRINEEEYQRIQENIARKGKICYSSKVNKFYDLQFVNYDSIPEPKVVLEKEQHAELLASFTKNKAIMPDENGYPIVVDVEDTLSLNELKMIKKREINSRRDNEQYMPFEYNGNFFDANRDAIFKINSVAILAMAASSTGQPFGIEWTTYDNKEVTLNANDLVGMISTLAKKVNIQHSIASLAKKMIESSSSREELALITWEDVRSVVLENLGLTTDGGLPDTTKESSLTFHMG